MCELNVSVRTDMSVICELWILDVHYNSVY